MKYGKRIAVYAAGLFLIALGVTISINSGLGVSPVNALPYVVSQITGRDVGKCVIVVFCSYILIQILILRRDFAWINLTQIICSTMFGYFVDITKWMLGDAAVPTYPGQLLMLAVSIILVAAGVSMYLEAKLIEMPMEGLTGAIAVKFFPGKPFAEVKVIMDCVVVGTAVLLSSICMGRVEGIREGTVLCALLVGRVMKPIQKVLRPAAEQSIFSKNREDVYGNT